MAKASVKFLDRADSGDIGGDWTQVPSTEAWQSVGGAIRPTGVNPQVPAEYNNTISPGESQFSECVIINRPSGAGEGGGPAVRMSTGAESMYFVMANGTNVELWIASAGTYFSLSINAGAVNVGDVVRLEAEGTALRVYVNGTQRISTTDSTHTTGRVGMAGTVTGAVANLQLNYWRGGELAELDNLEGAAFTPWASMAWARLDPASASVTVTPTTLALVTAAFAPVIQHKIVVPVRALTLTTFAPAARLGVKVTPSAASLTLATFPPSVAVTNNILVTPTTAALTTTRFAPVIKSTIIVPKASLALTTFPPVVKLGVIVPVRAFTLTTFAPTVSAPRLMTPTTRALTLTTFVPTVTATANVQVTPAPAALVISSFPADVTATGGQIQQPRAHGSAWWRKLPQPQEKKKPQKLKKRKRPVLVVPDTARLFITTYAPTMSVSRNVVVQTAAARLWSCSSRPLVVIKPSREGLARARAARLVEPQPEVVTIQDTVRAHRRRYAEFEPGMSVAELDALDFADLEEIGAMR